MPVTDTGRVVISRRVAWFLVAFGIWSWIIWPTFLKNIWQDSRSWDDGMTAFFAVHLVLTVVSLVLGTIIGVLGVRALRAAPAT
jgi:ABC-type polysaccharide/polyol phosphate export permease